MEQVMSTNDEATLAGIAAMIVVFAFILGVIWMVGGFDA